MKTYCMNGKVNGLIYLASVTGESDIHVAYNCVSGGTKINFSKKIGVLFFQ